MKKVLSQAIAAATIFGAATAAQALEVNHGGAGQALMFPYYSVENGNYTALHLTNTTDEYKAVKVRFRRYTDSADSLDFNLYLSPKDMWTGAVVAGGASENAIPKLISFDTSCISGQTEQRLQAGISFHEVVGKNAQKGHIEIIEMASWTQDQAEDAKVDKAGGIVSVADAVEHQEAGVDGVRRPGNCKAITDSWVAGEGYWATEYENNAEANGAAAFKNEDLGGVATGGLYGNAYVVNPDQAWASSFAPTALNNLYKDDADGNNHHAPRYALPDLQGKTGINNPAEIDIDSLVIGLGATGGQKVKLKELINQQNYGMVDFGDIEAELAKKSVMSDFTVGGASNATTELVVTFPVKYAGSPDGDVTVKATFYDREENSFLSAPEDWQTSPWLPGVDPTAPQLEHEVNVVNLADGSAQREDIGAHTKQLNLPEKTPEGWVDIEFDEETPVIGFTSTILKNGTLLNNGGVNSYSLSFPLKYTE